jgi:carboxypeptidase PM20D1
MSLAAEQLAALIGCRTVSVPELRSEAEFERARWLMRSFYPRLFELRHEVLDPGSLLFHWPGVSADHPIVLMAHYDVVPASAEAWGCDPFDGQLRDGRVWGRGALDDKGSVVAIASAVDRAIAAGVQPAHDVWVTFGADEETFGQGAALVADRLAAQGVEPWLVLDEGGAIVDDAIPLLKGRSALVGIGEKGAVDIEIVARAKGGHASTPTKHGAAAQLSRAIVALDRRLAPVHLSEPVQDMLRAVAGHLPWRYGRPLVAAIRCNRLLATVLSLVSAEFAALVRTTWAVTTLSGSQGRNVIADEARANLNVRLAVDDTIESVTARIMRIVRPFGVTIERVDGDNPPTVSDLGSPGWQRLVAVLADVDPDVRVIPYVQTGATDSRHLARLSASVYRLAPFDMNAAQRASIHGNDESLDIASLERGLEFYSRLVSGSW